MSSARVACDIDIHQAIRALQILVEKIPAERISSVQIVDIQNCANKLFGRMAAYKVGDQTSRFDTSKPNHGNIPKPSSDRDFCRDCLTFGKHQPNCAPLSVGYPQSVLQNDTLDKLRKLADERYTAVPDATGFVDEGNL
jgi:hypothetical protein